MLIFVAMLLSKNKIDYVLSHLQQHWLPSQRVEEAFVFAASNRPGPEGLKAKIVFLLSEQEQPRPQTICFEGEELLVLFPLSSDSSPFELDERGTLWFRHDFLSSAFYLLSGMQEQAAKRSDAYGRFSYDESLQKRYSFVNKPLVNYYFELILMGFEAYCERHGFALQRRRLFERFGFLLSHDVDRVAFHHPRLMAYRMLQLLGLKPSNVGKTVLLQQLRSGLRHHLRFGAVPDPWWTFSWMTALEKKLGLRSTFFFLLREEGRRNAWYRFNSRKIKSLITALNMDGFEVSLHGTFRSVDDAQRLQKQREALAKVSGTLPLGIRQHFLLFKQQTTFRAQEAAGLAYDSTLTFHDHDGYRNAYCYPFHPYDFENDRAFSIWEFPLVMMEVSVLQYRGLSRTGLEEAVDAYIKEALRFGGLISLLWHNCRLNELEDPGVQGFYERLLQNIVLQEPKALTGRDFWYLLENPILNEHEGKA